MPLLLVGLVVGLLVSVFQAVTQIQEQTLSFIPKIVAMGVVLVVAGPWMLDQVVTYTRAALRRRSRRWSTADERRGRCSSGSREQHVLAFALVLARVAPLFLLAPLFSLQERSPPASAASPPSRSRSASRRSRPHARRRRRRSPPTSGTSARLMVKELLVGMAFSFGIAALFAALSAAGALLDTLDRLHARRRRRPAHGHAVLAAHAALHDDRRPDLHRDRRRRLGDRRARAHLRGRAAARGAADRLDHRRRAARVLRHLRARRSRSARRSCSR